MVERDKRDWPTSYARGVQVGEDVGVQDLPAGRLVEAAQLLARCFHTTRTS